MLFHYQAKSKQKSVTDSFNLPVEMRRATSKNNAATSVIAGNLSDKNQLLEDIILEIDEYGEGPRKKRDERNSAE